MNLKTIIFDFGGVLVDWNPRNLYKNYFPNPQEMEDFLQEVNFMEWNAQQDKGRKFSEGVQILSEQFPHRAALIRAFHENWIQSINGSIEGSVKILRELKAKKHPLYGLSNWSMETFPLTRSRFSFFDLFDGILLSGEVQLIKPDPAIYELCLQMANKSAQECLFIDDSPANISTAQTLGFDAIHFKSPEQLRNELEKRNIL